MAKHKKKRVVFSSKKYLILSVIIFLLLIFIIIVGFILYELGYEEGIEEKRKAYLANIEALKKREHDVLQKYLEKKPSEIEDYEKNMPASMPVLLSSSSSSMATSSSIGLASLEKPKLIIIIDDVAYKYQVKALKSLNLTLNLSFFPSSSTHPFTPKYAKECRHYMIHLPLQATHYLNEEEHTLKIHSSKEEIERVIAKIREEFPAAKFINNHTGSRFTSSYKAMKRLIKVLRKYGFIFVDSKTTPYSKVAKVVKEFGDPYIARNIFLDNKPDIAYIQNQLKKAVHIAKKQGLAIAIGHPRKATIKALAKSKEILKEVQLIYIDEYY